MNKGAIPIVTALILSFVVLLALPHKDGAMTLTEEEDTIEQPEKEEPQVQSIKIAEKNDESLAESETTREEKHYDDVVVLEQLSETKPKTKNNAKSETKVQKEEPSKTTKKEEKPVFKPVKLWDKGEQVQEVQKLINKFGYSVAEDGSFGPGTQAVVQNFQSKVGIKSTGIVDENTYNKLKSTESTNLAAEYLAAIEEKKRLEEQKRKEEEERRKQQEAIDKANEIFIPVNKVMQKPELPNGCEITSLTSILNYHGFNVSKTTMADHYLPKKPFTYEGDKRFGPNPYEFYVGDPRQQPGGWYSYAPPIVSAANTYLSEQGSGLQAYNATGSSRDKIMDYLEKGIPVVTWVTLDLSSPKVNSHWYLQDSGEYYAATTNLHVVVLNGVIGDKVHVMNPLVGQVTYNADTFFNSYAQMGKHAVVVY